MKEPVLSRLCAASFSELLGQRLLTIELERARKVHINLLEIIDIR